MLMTDQSLVNANIRIKFRNIGEQRQFGTATTTVSMSFM